MSSYLAIFSLFIVFISVYMLIQLLSKPKKSVFTQFVQQKQQKTTRTEIRGLAKYFPNNVLTAAKKYEWNLSKRKYWILVASSGISFAISLYLLLGRDPLGLLAMPMGFSIPYFLLYLKKKKNYIVLLDRISLYMKSLANAYSVTNNLVYALNEIRAMMSKDIQDEIDKAVLELKGGKPVTTAFKDFNKRFGFVDLEFFHELLEIAHREGGKESLNALMDAVHDFEHQKFLLSKLRTGLAKSKKAFFQNTIIVFLIPAAIILFAPSGFEMVTSNILIKAAIGINIVAVLFMASRVEKISNYNPTDRR